MPLHEGLDLTLATALALALLAIALALIQRVYPRLAGGLLREEC